MKLSPELTKFIKDWNDFWEELEPILMRRIMARLHQKMLQ